MTDDLSLCKHTMHVVASCMWFPPLLWITVLILRWYWGGGSSSLNLKIPACVFGKTGEILVGKLY